MRAGVVVFVCLLLIAFATHSYAQIDDSAIPVCGPEETQTLAEILREYLSLVRGISQQAGLIELDDYSNHTDAVDQLITDMNNLQIQWREKGEPQLPRCALAVNAGTEMGGLLDEMLIAFLLLDADYAMFADWHADPIYERSADLWTLLEQLENRPA